MTELNLALLRNLLAQRDREITELRVANRALCEVVRQRGHAIERAQTLVELAIERACDGDRRAVLQEKSGITS
jgi:hypothetical protein